LLCILKVIDYNVLCIFSFSVFYFTPVVVITVKPVFFACLLFREFRDPDEFAKITGREYIF